MIKRLSLIFIFCFSLFQGGAQNWVPVPCYHGVWQTRTMFLDSLHNELIINNSGEHYNCNTSYKGILAYNGTSFHALDYGLETLDTLNLNTSQISLACIPYGGKTLFGGYFSSVGTNKLRAQSLALWDGFSWDTIAKRAFDFHPNYNGNETVQDFLKYQGKLWICGHIDTLGGMPGAGLYTFDGNSYANITMPVNNFVNISKMIVYKNELYVAGFFYDDTNTSLSMIAKYDSATWTSIGNGVHGTFDGIADMVIYRDTLYLGGAMNKANGNAGNHIMKWDGTHLYDAGFGNFYDWGAIHKLIVYHDKLYAFGNFTHAADQIAYGVAYYQDGQWTVPSDSIDNGISSAVVYNDEIYISGGFWSINGDSSMQYLAKLRCPDFDYSCVTGVKKNTLNQIEFEIYPNPAINKLTIEVSDAAIKLDRLSITNSLGQVLINTLNPTNKEVIDVSSLSKGIYYLSLQSKAGSTVKKFIKE